MKEKNWPNFNKQLISKVSQIISSGKINYTDGPYGLRFEKEFSKFVGKKFSIAICNGTVIRSCYEIFKITKNSEIIVPARSFFHLLHV